MSIEEYAGFILFFGFLIIWNYTAYHGITSPEKILETDWGRSAWRNASPKRLRWMSGVFLVFGIGILGISLWHLAQGTFKWRGEKKTYGFSDFIR